MNRSSLDRAGTRRVTVGRRIIAGAVALSLSAAVWADTGGLRISVVGTDGMPVSGATVKVSSPASLVSKTATTEADGTVRLLGLDPATNYTVEISASGFEPISRGNVAVVSGTNLSVSYSLGEQELEEVLVTGEALTALDTTSATVSTTITLDLTEALPTGRSFQSYLQLVPGVKPSELGNPSSKSGVNYSDIRGEYGNSTDNVYFVDGVNVTDPLTGTFGSNLNSEIIQEQHVLTGGVPAEFEGGAGLISRVVTKSGGDEFHGSLNYYIQNDSLVGKNKHLAANDFSTYDSALTLGGPILPGKLWFFGSYQKKSRKDDVTDTDNGALMRKSKLDNDLFFGKLTWQVTDNDRLQATFFNDPYERSARTDQTISNNHDYRRVQGGDNYKLEYSHDFGTARIDLYGFSHEGELSNLAAGEDDRNFVAFRTGTPSKDDIQQGSYGVDLIEFRNRDEVGAKLEYLMSTGLGDHQFKGGVIVSENQYKLDERYIGPTNGLYNSIALADSGVNFQTYRTAAGWTGARGLTSADRGIIIAAIDESPDAAYYYGLLDTDTDGTLTNAEIDAITFTSTAGNPTGQVNAYRSQMVQTEPVTYKSKGLSFFLQDSWTLGRWTVNAGARTERWSHYATTGDKLYTFDWKIAPRLSVVYDFTGNGSGKVWAFRGRYYDPIRNDMTDFAGTLTGPVREEAVFIGDRWLNFRTRGGPTQADAFFAPSTKTPYTDELLLGFAKNLTRDLNFTAIYTHRNTRDLLEDYDLHLYSSSDCGGADGCAYGTEFYLPLSYFGYDSIPDSNYVIATLKGGERKYDGVELSLRKNRSNNWQGLASYTYNGAKGNSNSDGNADFQGDWVALDPRAPNQWGKQPGNIEHQVKLAGSWFTNLGLEFGGVFNWNSGMRYSTAWLVSSRHLPIMVDEPYEYGGVTDTWIDEGMVGANKGPAFYTLDLRAKYTRDTTFGRMEAFVDVFNVLNKQMTIGQQDLLAGDGTYAFGEGTDWVSPRRLYLGMRVSF